MRKTRRGVLKSCSSVPIKVLYKVVGRGQFPVEGCSEGKVLRRLRHEGSDQKFYTIKLSGIFEAVSTRIVRAI